MGETKGIFYCFILLGSAALMLHEDYLGSFVPITESKVEELQYAFSLPTLMLC